MTKISDLRLGGTKNALPEDRGIADVELAALSIPGPREEVEFKLVTSFKPSGDQPQAIDLLSRGLKAGIRSQVLLGVTGSRQDLYHGPGYCRGRASRPCSGPE